MIVPDASVHPGAKMSSARAPLTKYLGAVALLWLILLPAGLLYAAQREITTLTTAAVLGAILIEAAFYVLPGIDVARAALERALSPRLLAAAMTASALVPYLVCSIPLGAFEWRSLAAVAAIAGGLSFWFVLAPRHAIFDLGFIAAAAALVLARVYDAIYPAPEGLPVKILGQAMTIRLGILAMLSLRRVKGVGFGFLPSAREWGDGLLHFSLLLPVAVLLGASLGFLEWSPPAGSWWLIAGVAAATFFGILWVVALSEEFFFRGLLQQWVTGWLNSPLAGLLIASVLFGLVHLPFREFPNWRFALLAAVAGLFYGRSYQRTGSIRSAMVVHALTVTVWRVFLS